MVNASISTPASSNDLAKKKRVNRTAKLKQSNLDVRRQQWLSQVKTKDIGLKEEANGVKMPEKETHAAREREHESSLVKLEICVDGEENEGLMGSYSDSESPLSHTSSGNRSVTNFTGSSMMVCGGSSSSGSSRGCCAVSITDEDDRHDDEDEDDCEAMADALAADEIENNCSDPDLESALQEKQPKPEVVLIKQELDQLRRDMLVGFNPKYFLYDKGCCDDRQKGAKGKRASKRDDLKPLDDKARIKKIMQAK